MRAGRMRCCFRSSRLNDDDWFAESHFACSGKEGACVADGFHIQKNALRLRVLAKKRNQISPTHIEHRAGRDDGAESNLFLKAPIKDCRQQGSALTEEGYVASPGDVLCKGRVES